MKSKDLFLGLIGSFFITTTILAQVPTSGLVASYSFTGNANDKSINGNGVVYGALATADRFGNPNAAYSFNGTNAYIEIPINALLNNEYSYSIWVNPTSIPGSGLYTYPFAIGNSAGQNVSLTNNSMNGWSGGASNIGTPTLSLVATGILPNLNEWVHLVYMRDSSSIRLYVNGILNQNIVSYGNYNTSTGGNKPDYGSSPSALIGNRDHLSQFFFNGKIDDINIYNRTLTNCEINTLYTNKSLEVKTLSTNESSLNTCDGYLEAVAKGIAPYTYHWNDNTINSQYRNNMCGGNYSVTVTDSVGCSVMAQAHIGKNNVPSTNLNPLTISVSSTNASNSALCNGYATATVSGGTPPYNIYFAGSTVNDSVDFLNNLCSGFYTVNASDAKSNTTSFTFVIGSPVTTYPFVNPVYKDSTAKDTLVTNAIPNCSINYNAIDSIGIFNYGFIGLDSVNIAWKIYQGNTFKTQNAKYEYFLPGLYTFVLDLFCTNRASGSAKGIDKLYINKSLTDIETHETSYISIYPNPSNGTFTIRSANEGIYSIINEMGQTIQVFKLNSTNKYSVNIENLSNGIYFVVGFNDNQTTHQKVVVLK